MEFFSAYILVALCVLLFSLVYALYAVYAERKVSAFIQDRYGPMETGKFGLLQTIADITKLLQKENITPAAADKALFIAAPLIIFVSVFMGFAAMPFAPDVIGSGANIGVFYIIAVLAVEVVGILMAGWTSGNKHPMLGSMLLEVKFISYTILACV